MDMGAESPIYKADHCLRDFMPNPSLSGVLHVGVDHRGVLIWAEDGLLSVSLNLNGRLPIFVDDIEREVLDIGLDIGIIELASNKTPASWVLHIGDDHGGVHNWAEDSLLASNQSPADIY